MAAIKDLDNNKIIATAASVTNSDPARVNAEMQLTVEDDKAESIQSRAQQESKESTVGASNYARKLLNNSPD